MMIKSTGKPNRSPLIFCNDLGQPVWSGKYEHQITGTELTNMMQFTRRYARRKGYNDTRNGAATVDCFFHPSFMKGSLFDLWHDSYHQGVEDFLDSEPLGWLNETL
ncbi:hypothetical protein [Motilimonas eburnea]|uniref:hypothetical protein n=1 Tax=Motilimonas eburnea TaxID=1737488 RepID=UPI001E5F042F|nr:hypothetical protein [Motilimonas eburnea]MCE2571653.1 hypothetical protein [Motilimonas eburnea]